MVSSAAATPASLSPERTIGLAAAAVAALALAFAFAMESLMNLPPCSLCTYQRWAYVAVIVLGGGAALSRGGRGSAAVLAGLAGAAFLVGAGIAGFHAGVEHGWWSAGGACEGELTNIDITQLQQRLQNLQEPPCDEVRWRLFGVFSLAEMNIAASLAFGVATLASLARAGRRG